MQDQLLQEKKHFQWNLPATRYFLVVGVAKPLTELNNKAKVKTL